ncbi:hypothetical protein PMIN01_09046 [Paraphaeosphaeria minitans]|uniref:Uncharacterized protein n=1 Tax=Paraphaeosphaeria minitans TaxID=565426 RepID=A0A9P6GE03_9PLEO|nr:hypothetical protein PMIN01_09046 [Paraphaeosphaeria minitans]
MVSTRPRTRLSTIHACRPAGNEAGRVCWQPGEASRWHFAHIGTARSGIWGDVDSRDNVVGGGDKISQGPAAYLSSKGASNRDRRRASAGAPDDSNKAAAFAMPLERCSRFLELPTVHYSIETQFASSHRNEARPYHRLPLASSLPIGGGRNLSTSYVDLPTLGPMTFRAFLFHHGSRLSASAALDHP